MIKAELSYNPYLLETIIKFNGREPRINSLVEKFQDGSLQKWVHRIPDIFYDEMNGYDFELEFSGTKRDYLEVVSSFRRKQISEELVRIFHKNELDGRKEKIELIDQLIMWLGSNANRNFDFQNFMEEHGDFLKRTYPYIIFQGNSSDDPVDNKEIDIEHVDGIAELEKTDLKNTPILFCVSKDNFSTFQKDLKWFMNREEIVYDQLFFLIHPSLDADKIERILKDLGIQTPNLVNEIEDESILKYLELYPETEYIYEVIVLFKEIIGELSDRLQEESNRCAIKNREVHERIDQYEDNLRRLKESYQKFTNKDNLDIPDQWYMIQSELLERITSWRKRKTKITDDYEAEIVANDFESDATKYYVDFLGKIENAALTTKQDIEEIYETWYKEAAFDSEFHPDCREYMDLTFNSDIRVAEELKKIVEEEWVQPKEDIFGLFFKASNDAPKEPVLQRTFYYEKWREYVLTIVKEKEEQVIQMYFDKIQKYEDTLVKTYMEHLEGLISDQTRLKEQESAKLSDEERLLQNDLDWLVNVQDQMAVIERG